MDINRLIRSMLRHSPAIIIFTLLVTVFMGYKALRVNIDTNVNTLMPRRNHRISLIREEIGVESEMSNYFFLTISGKDLYDLEILGTFQNTIDRILEMPEFEGVLSPFNFIFFGAEGTRIVPSSLSVSGRAPATPEELAEFEARIKEQSLSKNFVVADDGRILTAVFLTGRIEEDTADVMRRFQAAVTPLEEKVRVHYSGGIPFQDRIAFHLGKDFSTLLILSVTAMLIIFWLSFRTVRAVILPTVVVVIGTIWTIGFMSMVGFEITVVSVIIPALILTLGSSYTIHILSEYYRNTRAEGAEKCQWLADSVEHVIRTVVVAALTTMISFLSLLTTTLAPLQEFGLAIGLGIFFCAVLALFFLPATFALLPTPKSRRHRERMRRGLLSRMAAALGGWSGKHPFLIAGLFVALFAGFLLVYPHIKHQSDYFSYFPSDDRIIKDTQFINEHTGGSQTFNITLSAPEGEEGFFLDPKVLQSVDEFETLLDAHPSVTNKLSFLGILKAMNGAVTGEETVPESRGLILLLNRYFRMIPTGRFVLGQDSSIMSEDGSSLTIYLKMTEAETYQVMNEDDLKAFLDYVEEGLEKTVGASMDSYLWGNTMLLLDSSRTIKRDQLRSTVLSMILGMVISAVFFKSFAYSVIALIPLLSGIFWYFLTLFVSGIPLDMTTIIVTNVTVGVGLDDAVHFILQYRMQRCRQPYRPALSWSLRITGRAIVLTTLSMVAGLMVLCFGSFKPVVYLGYLVAGTLFSTMVGTVVFIPAAITLLERAAGRKKVLPTPGV